jgi:hypothetical protein
MDRGLRAQLSPNEESTFRRIARAGLPQAQSRPEDTAQLAALQLIEIRDGTWYLTALGSERLETVLRR